MDKLKNMGMEGEACGSLWEEMSKKDICEEGKREGAELSNYVPTFEEFEVTINI